MHKYIDKLPTDSRLFVSRIIGAVKGGALASPLLILRYFNGLVNSKIKSVASEYMIKRQISFLEISQYLSELSDEFKDNLEDEFERFGIELTNFYCVSIAPRREEYEKLQQYKEELALGSNFYQQRRTLDILEKLAENPSGGSIANAGMGLGMGLTFAGQAGHLFNNANPTANSMQAVSQPSSSVCCPNCGAQNPSGMKFCGECGNPLSGEIVCPRCGAHIPASMKFCGECGLKLGKN